MQRCNFRKRNKKLQYTGSMSYPEKVASLHPAKFSNVRESVSTFADLSATLADFLETQSGPPLYSNAVCQLKDRLLIFFEH